MYDMLSLIDTDLIGFVIETYHRLPHFNAHFRQWRGQEKLADWAARFVKINPLMREET